MATKSFWEKYGKHPAFLAMITIIGAVITGVFTYYWTKQNMVEQQEIERERALEVQRIEFKKQAYADFMQGQTLMGQPDKKSESDSLIYSSKLRIILMGSREVLCSMSDYWTLANKYPTCLDPAEKIKDAAIYQSMRREFFQSLGATESSEVEAAILVPYLRNCTLPGESVEQICKRK